MYRYDKRHVVAGLVVNLASTSMGVVLEFEAFTKLVVVFWIPYISVALHLAVILNEQKVKESLNKA